MFKVKFRVYTTLQVACLNSFLTEMFTSLLLQSWLCSVSGTDAFEDKIWLCQNTQHHDLERTSLAIYVVLPFNDGNIVKGRKAVGTISPSSPAPNPTHPNIRLTRTRKRMRIPASPYGWTKKLLIVANDCGDHGCQKWLMCACEWVMLDNGWS